MTNVAAGNPDAKAPKLFIPAGWAGEGQPPLYTAAQIAALVEAQQPAPSAAAADTVVLEAALRAIHQAIDLIGEPDTERLRTVRRVLRGAVVVAEDCKAPQADSAPSTVTVEHAIRIAESLGVREYGPNTRNWSFDYAQLSRFVAAITAPQADSVTAPAAGAVAGPALAPSAFVNAAGIKADDKPGTVVRKLDAAFHDAVTFADAAQQVDARLWCVHVQGPDDVIAMPSKSAALEHANDLNALFGRHPYEEGDPIMRAVVIEWPHSADNHAADLAIQDATHGAAPTPPAQAADSVLEDAARLDWLESQPQVNIERVRYLGADTSIYEVTPFNSTDYNGETLRKAIDAARKQGGAT